jgi:hypothetical protein
MMATACCSSRRLFTSLAQRPPRWVLSRGHTTLQREVAPGSALQTRRQRGWLGLPFPPKRGPESASAALDKIRCHRSGTGPGLVRPDRQLGRLRCRERCGRTLQRVARRRRASASLSSICKAGPRGFPRLCGYLQLQRPFQIQLQPLNTSRAGVSQQIRLLDSRTKKKQHASPRLTMGDPTGHAMSTA